MAVLVWSALKYTNSLLTFDHTILQISEVTAIKLKQQTDWQNDGSVEA